ARPVGTSARQSRVPDRRCKSHSADRPNDDPASSNNAAEHGSGWPAQWARNSGPASPRQGTCDPGTNSTLEENTDRPPATIAAQGLEGGAGLDAPDPARPGGDLSRAA